MKKCTKCGVQKPLTEFTKVSRNKDGLRNSCRECHNLYARDITKRYLKRHPGRRTATAYRAKLKTAYGLTPEEKEALEISQNKCCAICKDPLSGRFQSHVDHIHGSNPAVIRGILCPQCNIGLGNFKDSPERLANAIIYLTKFLK